MPKHAQLPDIYSFTDYRRYLEEAMPIQLAFRKMSWRAMSREAGFASPNYLQQVIQCMRHLGASQAHAVVKYLGLNEDECRYFVKLIVFCEAKLHSDRDSIFRELMAMRRKRKIKGFDDSYYAFFSHWWVPVVWELAVHPQSNGGDAAWIAKKIRPNITVSQTEKALDILQSLQLIERSADNQKWLRKESTLHTASEVRSLAATNYHLQAMDLAKDALERIPSDERDFRSITIGLSIQETERFKSRLTQFWQEILAESSEDESKDNVFHLHFQFYPVSEEIRE